MDIVFKVRKTKQCQHFLIHLRAYCCESIHIIKMISIQMCLFAGLDMLKIAALGLMKRVTLTEKNYIQN
jgi:hypothetical protein